MNFFSVSLPNSGERFGIHSALGPLELILKHGGPPTPPPPPSDQLTLLLLLDINQNNMSNVTLTQVTVTGDATKSKHVITPKTLDNENVARFNES